MSGGGVMKGRESKAGKPVIPEFHPCIREAIAMPNITFMKKAKPSKTLVTCQSPNFTGESLKLEKSKYSGGRASTMPLERNNLETSSMNHQNNDLLFMKSTLKSANVARTRP